MDWIRKSINFTPEEFDKLEDMRGTTPRATFVKSVIFNNHGNTNNTHKEQYNLLLILLEDNKLGYTDNITSEELKQLEEMDYW